MRDLLGCLQALPRDAVNSPRAPWHNILTQRLDASPLPRKWRPVWMAVGDSFTTDHLLDLRRRMIALRFASA